MLRFLKELPDRYLLVLGFFATMLFYAYFQHDAILQLMLNFAVAIIALSQKKQEPHTSITTDTVETPSVNTQEITNSTVNTDSLNVKDEKKTEGE